VRSLPTIIGWRATAKLRSQRIFIHQSDGKAAFQSTSVERNVTVLSNGCFEFQKRTVIHGEAHILHGSGEEHNG
jgi:hypothetical protein